jgi:hypothetical protein
MLLIRTHAATQASKSLNSSLISAAAVDTNVALSNDSVQSQVVSIDPQFEHATDAQEDNADDAASDGNESDDSFFEDQLSDSDSDDGDETAADASQHTELAADGERPATSACVDDEEQAGTSVHRS